MTFTRMAKELAYQDGLAGKAYPAAGELYLEWEKGFTKRMKRIDLLPFPLNTDLVIIYQPDCDFPKETIWHAFLPGTIVQAKSYHPQSFCKIATMLCVSKHDFIQQVPIEFLALPQFPAGRRVLNGF
ncbi:hypothetical protein DRN75_00985 [Nanoarchaeota archaeon]|nr:MAG: hypothetical protein DRN75_00985 [Nanoarchaeota archaeon]